MPLVLVGLSTYACGDEDFSADETKPSKKIVGGTQSAANSWPYIVRLPNQSCGGSLVAPRFILTAAHCVDGSVRPSNVAVVIGRENLSDRTDGEDHTVTDIIIHPKWNAGNFDYDVALLRLARSSNIPPVEVALSNDPSSQAFWSVGTMATVAGWGRTTEGGTSPTRLRQVTVPILADSTARRSEAYGSRFFPSTMLAAGNYSTGGQDACQGDSGGPLVVNGRNGDLQVGIVSWGTGCARPRKPGVYTRLGARRISKWVRTVMHETPVVGDFNGDGRDDIATFTHGSATTGPKDVWVALSNGSSFGRSSIWQQWWCHWGLDCLAGDFNGDGRDDIWSISDSDVWIALSTGTSFNGAIYHFRNMVQEDDIARVGDVNGDGRDDLVVFTMDRGQNVEVRLSRGTSFRSRQRWHNYFGIEGESVAVADVNGDNRDDIITFNQSMNGNNVWVARSTGSSFGTSSRWNTWFALAGEAPEVGDFNGDGRADITTFTRAPLYDVYVGRSNGFSNFSSTRWHTSFGSRTAAYRTGDFNGDGRDDIIYFTQDATADARVSLSNGASFGGWRTWHGYFAP
ncbi:MAG: trypsin-like serine protease [Myxococcota bacterium]